MIHELAHYDVYPRIVKAGTPTTVTIRPLGSDAAFTDGAVYTMQFLPLENSREPLHDYDLRTAAPDGDGCLRVNYEFPGEQEYYLRLFRPGDVHMDESALDRRYSPARAYTYHLYALEPDLYGRRPYRGDFHAHSTRSDGCETPAFVAANYRKYGFDFFSLTDHGRYRPSVECAEAFAGKPVDLLIVRGEEVHAPENHVHAVNFGSRYSVNDIFNSDKDKYREEVKALSSELRVPPGVNAFEYASCIWIFREIRKAGGLAIFCHPHWLIDVYHVPDRMSEALFASGEFDAFELLGGQEVFSNNIQTAFYQEQRALGRKIPIVGSSDSHCSELLDSARSYWFTWLSTLVFSSGLDTGGIMDAVKNHFSVAVEKYPGETEPRVYGSYRAVKYAKFLLKYYFPMHDELCFEEGRLMKDLLLGSETAEKILALMKGRTAALLEHCWGEIASP